MVIIVEHPKSFVCIVLSYTFLLIVSCNACGKNLFFIRKSRKKTHFYPKIRVERTWQKPHIYHCICLKKCRDPQQRFRGDVVANCSACGILQCMWQKPKVQCMWQKPIFYPGIKENDPFFIRKSRKKQSARGKNPCLPLYVVYKSVETL